MRVDLHMHSSYSDGADDIAKLITRAKQNDYSLVSLTDHDTCFGTKEMLSECKKQGIKSVSGVEISTFEEAEIHILGLNFDYSPHSAVIKKIDDTFSKARKERIRQILKKLKALNFDITIEELESKATVSISRKHIAEIMVAKGYVNTVGEAFSLYLSPDKPAWVPFFLISPCQAVEIIRSGGGMAVLAHPARLGLTSHNTEKLVKKLKNAGLEGIESYYFAHSKAEVWYYKELAKKYSLVNTNGSDYHGRAVHYSNNEYTYAELETPCIELLNSKYEKIL